jgi:two-component system phosphate regulon sensor histidine kinase PhoR
MIRTMHWSILARPLRACALAAGLAVLTLLLGAPAALAAVIGAIGGVLVVLPAPGSSPPPPAAAGESGADAPGPGIDELIEAITDPVLLIERQSVTRANAAARLLLGDHIVGGDVRLAIRHPAAAERLIGPLPAIGPPQPVELIGLGERARRWEMLVHPLVGGARLVRLGDRTGAHAIERMRVDFVANASHELRTPLATLLGFIETLEDAGEDPATRARFLQIMFREAKRMQRLVEDLMSLSRIEADKYSAPQQAVALPALIDEVRDALRTGLVPDADRIVVALADDLPPVAGDPAQLSQLLYNVIGNAAKYGRAGGPIQVSLDCVAGGMVRLTVEDEGEGIPPEHLPRLTERFYRVDPGRSRALGGTGLGLSIVKHIVERHRGRLDISSIVGRGTTVAIRLPAAPGSLSSNCHLDVTQDGANAAIRGMTRT